MSFAAAPVSRTVMFFAHEGSGDVLQFDPKDPLKFVTNTGLPESSPFRFKAKPGPCVDLAGKLVKKLEEVDPEVALLFQKAVLDQKAELKKCKDVGCPCGTEEGSTKWINELITTPGETQYDLTGISILFSRLKMDKAQENKCMDTVKKISLVVEKPEAKA